ncbi:MAG: ferrous iron transport protein A [Mycobacteriales bacterium]
MVRYSRDVGPGDSGVRVSLRRALPEGGYGDVLGQLLSWTDVVRIERRDGVVVEVPSDTVVACKRVPPAPERR